MNCCNTPIETLANVLAHAKYEGFPRIEYEDRDWSIKEKKLYVTKTRHHSNDDIDVIAMFPQVWSSTALGFGGVGGQAITTAYTIVLESDYYGYAVYFGSRFAYNVKRKASEQFYLDLQGRHMASVADHCKYEKEE